jgi:protein-S-isoprenylcysteine O-methyltransferase Ste14
MLLHLGAAILLGWILAIPLPGWAVYAGWIVIAAGIAFAFGGLRQLISAHTSPDPHAPTTTVVTTGIYRFTRNPVYMGFLCLVIGFPLIFGNLWGIFVAAIQVLLFNKLIIEREEAYLTQKFGQEYLDYKSRVRRWL